MQAKANARENVVNRDIRMVPAWLFVIVSSFISLRLICLQRNGRGGRSLPVSDGRRRTVKRHRPRINATATGDDAYLTA